MNIKSDDQMKEAGLRITMPRKAVFDILFKAQEEGAHLSAEEVFLRLREVNPKVGLATVYRTLAQFEDAGLIEKNSFEGNSAVYELAPEDHHDHLVCSDCGVVVEFHSEVIEAEQDKLAEAKGFEIVNHTMNLFCKCTKVNCPNRKGDSGPVAGS